MFKRLKEKISEEVKQLPLGQYAPFKDDQSTKDSSDAANGSSTSAQNLIDLNDSVPADTVDMSASEGFSIGGDDDDGLSSRVASPAPTPAASFENVDLSDTMSSPTSPDPSSVSSNRSPRASCVEDPSSNLFPIYSPAAFNHRVHSDLESASEVEDSVVNLDAISKARLYEAFQTVKSRYVKYKARYGDVVKAYKDQLHETDKVRVILTESQDKALRRISELKEQSQLDHKAKQHLEENFRETLDEKEELVRVLQTQVRLLKASVSSAVESEVVEKPKSNDVHSEDNEDVDMPTKLRLQEDTINKLKNLLKSCKETIMKQRASLAEAEAEANAQMAQFAEELQRAAERADELERRDEDRAVQMAESKRRVHEEMAVREDSERCLKEQLQHVVAQLEAQQQEKSNLVEELEAVQSTVGDQSAISSVENELAKLQENLKNMESDAESLRAENSSLKSDIISLSEEVVKLNSHIETESQRNADLDLSLERSRAELAALQSDSEVARSEAMHKLSVSEKVIEELDRDLRVEKEEVSRIKSILADFEEELRKAKAEIPVIAALNEEKLKHEKLKQMKFQEAVHCLRQQMTEIRSSVDEKRKDFSLAFESLFTANRDVSNRYAAQATETKRARQEVALLKQKLEIAQNSIEETNRNAENLALTKDSETDNLTLKLNRAETNLEEAMRTSSELQRKVDLLQIRLGEVELENGSILSVRDDFDRQAAALKADSEDLTREVSSLKVRNEVLLQEVEMLTTVKNDLDCQVESLKIQAASCEVAELRQQKDDLQAIVDSMREENANLKLEANSTANWSEEIVAVHRAELERCHLQHESSLNDVNHKYEELLQEKADLKAQLVAEKVTACDAFESQVAELKLSLDQAKITENDIRASDASKADIIQGLREEADTWVSERNSLEYRIRDVQHEFDGFKDKFAVELAARDEESRVALNACETVYKEKLALLNLEKEESSSTFEAKEKRMQQLREELESVWNEQKSDFEARILQLESTLRNDQDFHQAELTELRLEHDQKYKELISEKLAKEELSRALEAKEECMQQLREELESVWNRQKSDFEERIMQLELMLRNNQDRHQTELTQLRLEHEQKYNELISEKESLSAVIAKKNEQIDESLVLAQDNEMRSLKVQRDLQKELEDAHQRADQQQSELDHLLQSQSEEHMDEVRRVTKHFEQVIAEREEAAAVDLAAAIERGQNDDNRMRREHAEQLRDIGIEITEKEVALEAALEESRERNKTLESELESLHAEHRQQLRAVETKWKSVLDKESRKLESAHCEELDGLYQEWQIEKKVPFSTALLNSEELQKEASLATLVLESGDQSGNLLRRQIMSMQKQMEALKDCHRSEVAQLKDAMRTNNCPIPLRLMDGKSRDHQRLESLEMEYLKNILFEYMMGRERLTMAKVISAVVRFSEEQTSKIIEREESRGVGGQIAQLLK